MVVACQDNATGTGYLMYSEEDVATRFAANPPAANNASHFVCVKYDSGQWKYDNDQAYYNFTSEPSDVLAAAVNYDTDTVTTLQGTNTTEYGIAKGYATGNLNYYADLYYGIFNDGEFTVGGTNFTPNALLEGTKYYYAGSTRVAMRKGSTAPLWLIGDHLGSTSQTANYDGTAYSGGNQLYKPWGEKRFPTGASGLPTTYRYTGQRQDSYINLYWYGSRWYDDYPPPPPPSCPYNPGVRTGGAYFTGPASSSYSERGQEGFTGFYGSGEDTTGQAGKAIGAIGGLDLLGNTFGDNQSAIMSGINSIDPNLFPNQVSGEIFYTEVGTAQTCITGVAIDNNTVLPAVIRYAGI
jgi:hypothetical protein